MVRDPNKKYTLNECMELPNHGVQISGDPETEEGQITICIPKSLLNNIELAFADILLQHDNKDILGTDYLIQMGRWDAIADKYSEIYDGDWFAGLLKELPGGWEPLDTFSYYAALAGFSVEDHGKEQKGNGDFGSASGAYEPLDYVRPSIDIPSSAGGMSIPLYLQYDSRWGNLSWAAHDTITSAGCGPASLAMVLSFLTGKCIYPSDVRAWAGAYNSRYCESGGSSKQALFLEGSQKWGVTCVYIPAVSTNAMMNALSKGYPVIVSTGAYHTTEFTNKGHFIVLRGLTEDGKILVNDPNDKIGVKNHYLKAYEPAFIEKACHWTKGGGIKYGFYFYTRRGGMKKGTTDRHLLICFLFTGIILILIHIIFSNLEKRMKDEKKEALEKQEIYLDDTLIVTGGDEDTPMCMTWTTAEGEVVWEGITPEAYEKTSGAEKKEFLNWYNKYVEDQCYQSILAIAYEETPYEYFSDLCRDYSGLIPYLKDGREYR